MIETEITNEGGTIIVIEISEGTWIIGIIGHPEMIVVKTADIQVRSRKV